MCFSPRYLRLCVVLGGNELCACVSDKRSLIRLIHKQPLCRCDKESKAKVLNLANPSIAAPPTPIPNPPDSSEGNAGGRRTDMAPASASFAPDLSLKKSDSNVKL